MSKIAHLGTVTLDTKLATSHQLNADEILANGEDVAEMFNREDAYREMETRVKLQPEDNYILYTDDGTVVTANLSGVANGTRLFYNQTKLTEIPLSWKLDSITDGTSMCESCTNLTTFSFPLNSLSSGSGMFSGCSLNEKSVENILKTIPIYSSGTHVLTLNMSADAFEKFNEITGNYLMTPGTISYKGWDITSNAFITISVGELTAAIEEIVGEGKVIVDTVPTENKVVVHTDRVDDTQLEAVTALLERVLPQNIEVARYNLSIDISWRDLDPALAPELAGKYNECKTVDEMLAVDPDCRNDITEDGAFLYPIEKLETGCDSSGQGLFNGNKKIKRLWDKTTLKNLKKGGQAWSISHGMFNNSTLEELPNALTLENLSDGQHMFAGTKIKTIPANVNLSKVSNFASMFEDCRNLTRCESTLNLQAVTRSGNQFRNTMFDAESACRILNNLPEKKLTIMIGIHIDHQYDDEVLAAIANAEAKGWTLTVQWTGTPTTSASMTYGLRKPPIYARVIEDERPDGTIQQNLDWGHYVTHPELYEEFASVEEAREYFGLPSENIEEEELTNV